MPDLDQSRQPSSSGGTTTSDSAGRPGLLRSLVHRLAGDPIELPVEGHLPSFEGATGWLNSEPLTPDGLRGRVVLVDFWTYTCVNWLRTAPYLRAWAAKYGGQGLTIIGAHTPEFGFERSLDNVTEQSRRLGVEYPIAIDSDYGVWRAFANHFWPAVYIADAEGRIRYHHFGEEAYAETEMVIQQLLLAAGADGIDQDLVMVEPRGIEVAADWRTLRSPETYTGYRQANGFAQEGEARFDAARRYAAPARLPAEPVGPRRVVDRGRPRRPARRGRRTDRVRVPRPRRQPRHGSGLRGTEPRSPSGSSSDGRPATDAVGEGRGGPMARARSASSGRTS
jgi:thiol-disulfide isomerase/thioredoxin